MVLEGFKSTNYKMSHSKIKFIAPMKKPLTGGFFLRLKAYFFEGGRSVQLPWATSAAMPMLSPNVGCG